MTNQCPGFHQPRYYEGNRTKFGRQSLHHKYGSGANFSLPGICRLQKTEHKKPS